MNRIFTISFSLFLLLVIGVNYVSPFDDGVFGLTKRDGGVGCICHGDGNPSSFVSVWFSGPDSIATGDTAYYRLYLSHGPAVTGGLNVASYLGRIDTLPIDTILQRKNETNELSHKHPKPFVNDTVYWTFKYTAPLTPIHDTLYAVANSTNNNGIPDTGDHWNFSPNFVINVYNPIGIKPIASTAYDYSLSQNYPNPFNPTTNIRYYLKNSSFVTLEVFDITGKSSYLLINSHQSLGWHDYTFDGSNYSSGVYIYRIRVYDEGKASVSYQDVKKMILLK